ncbi:hypothetical protein KDL21_01255 [Pseudomonas syringae pv. syringae]|uniref:hypothetical protein n=1 Tax=Pseudomonas syringae group TaxID=136849 RepID=UPI000EFFCF37|nr:MULTISPECIES: hypothetical protein [Pseudomonas syringae group]MDC3739648.1 hypothetical protein [Pseudomonas syringae pv. syringae]RMP22165.1 hypothetical protein ALQ25_01740 [Pseudomonas coronafaciens pv. atropurpurea]
MSRRDWYDRRLDKRVALQIAEEKGLVADSSALRASLVARIKSGEMTIEQAQGELGKVKREAKKNGLKTRDQIWRSA